MKVSVLVTLLTNMVLFVFSQQFPNDKLAQSRPQNGFLRNLGQVRGLDDKVADYVLYQANLGGQQIFITRYGLSILFSKINKVQTRANTGNDKIAIKGIQTRRKVSSADSSMIINYELERIDIVLKKANILSSNIISRSKPNSAVYNLYFDSYKPEQTGLTLQEEVLIRNVYPGIDWKIYIKEDIPGQPFVKYDFIVHPGADISLIKLKYSNNVDLKLLPTGLIAKGRMGELREDNPVSFLIGDHSSVAVKFELKKNELSFKAANYDRSQTLVIDPSIFWLTYISSTIENGQHGIHGEDIESDSNGNIFVQLSAKANTPFPTINPGNGAYYQDITAAPNGSMLLLKFAPGGQLLWSTYFGSQYPITGKKMTIDKAGNIVAIGGFVDVQSTIPLLDNGGYFDASVKKFFITKFSNAGTLLWSSFYFNFSSYPTDMTFDVNGNVYVVGWSEFWNFPVVDPGGGAYVVTNPAYHATQVFFVSQFDASNNLTWSTRIEGNDYDWEARICTDKSGNIFIGGNARSTNLPLLDAGGYFNPDAWGAAVFRFNPARQLTWSTPFPSPHSIADVTTDDEGNLYVVADSRIFKFDKNTQLVFVKSVNTTRQFFWNKINFDPLHNQLQLLGNMNDNYSGFPTVNVPCNGSFFNDGQYPNYFNATGPIFATITTDGEFTYRSLVDWVYEYYEYSEMTIDPEGNTIYLFGDQRNGYTKPNPQLTDPGNGAYFDTNCCYLSSGRSSLLLKLTPTQVSVNSQITAPTDCGCNGAVELTYQCGTLPFSYLWSNGATTPTVSGLCPGDYQVKITDANQLSSIINITIPYPAGGVSAVNKIVIPENCTKSNASISIQSVLGGVAPYTYSLDGIAYSPGTEFKSLDSGRYILHVKDANGCVYNDTIDVDRIAGPQKINFETKESSCVGDDGQLNVLNVEGGVAPYQFHFDGNANSSGIFSSLTAGSYVLNVTDAAGCEFSEPVTIKRAIPPAAVSITTENDHCGQSLGVIEVGSVTGGSAPYQFSIDNIAYVTGPITNLAAGTYDIYIKDENGCVLKETNLVISDEAAPSGLDILTKHAICGETKGTVSINAVQGGFAPYQYELDGGSYSPTAFFPSVSPGAHRLLVKDNYGCVFEHEFTIDYVPMVQLKLIPADTVVCYDEMVDLRVSGDISQVNNVIWNIPASGFSSPVKATNDKDVVVIITDKNNCIINATASIRVKGCNPPEKCVYVPTAFSPNGDGKNESVAPIANGCRIENLVFRIYNRWGSVVFESTSLDVRWDGRFKGADLPADAYVFVCIYTTEDQITRQQSGTIMLIR